MENERSPSARGLQMGEKDPSAAVPPHHGWGLPDAQIPLAKGVSHSSLQQSAEPDRRIESSQRVPAPRDATGGFDILQTTNYYLASRQNTNTACNPPGLGGKQGERGGRALHDLTVPMWPRGHPKGLHLWSQVGTELVLSDNSVAKLRHNQKLE